MLNCEKFKQLKDKFLQGDISPEEEKAIEFHLENCTACRQMLDEWLAANETENVNLKDNLLDVANGSRLNEKKQRSILLRAKYRNRINIALSLLLLFAVLNIAGSILSSLYFNRGGENSILYKTQKTAALLTEFSFPNITMPLSFSPPATFFSRAGWGHSSVEIKPYFVVKGNYALQKQVGKEKIVIGHLNINHLFSSVLTRRQWENGEYQHYLYFYHPDQLPGLDNRHGHIPAASEETWHVLDVLPEGTVAELSLSLLDVYSIDQVKAMLNDFDLEITWYAIATGLEGKTLLGRNPDYSPSAHDNTSLQRHSAPLSAFNGAWGLPELSRNMLIQHSPVSQEDSALREKYFLESMRFLVENEKIARRLYQGNPRDLRLTERFQYIKDNGIQVYGIVITGPTKELLKLQELKTVHSPALGDVELWNWFDRSFSGTMY